MGNLESEQQSVMVYLLALPLPSETAPPPLHHGARRQDQPLPSTEHLLKRTCLIRKGQRLRGNPCGTSKTAQHLYRGHPWTRPISPQSMRRKLGKLHINRGHRNLTNHRAHGPLQHHQVQLSKLLLPKPYSHLSATTVTTSSFSQRLDRYPKNNLSLRSRGYTQDW